jgi:hypothetical protein
MASKLPVPPHGYESLSEDERKLWFRCAPLFDHGFCIESDALYLEIVVKEYVIWKKAEREMLGAQSDQHRSVAMSVLAEQEEALVDSMKEMHHGNPPFSISEFERLLLPEE